MGSWFNSHVEDSSVCVLNWLVKNVVKILFVDNQVKIRSQDDFCVIVV